LADEAVKGYLADPRADRGVAQKLTEAWTLRELVKKASDQVDSLQTEQQELEKSSRETRLSLEAIEKNNQPRTCASSSPSAWPTSPLVSTRSPRS
jgi:hypothetical protein